jgi:hypothetical protein
MPLVHGRRQSRPWSMPSPEHLANQPLHRACGHSCAACLMLAFTVQFVAFGLQADSLLSSMRFSCER